ncbi:hypothetical protein AB0J89_03315 [Micromonospora chokoriensis]
MLTTRSRGARSQCSAGCCRAGQAGQLDEGVNRRRLAPLALTVLLAGGGIPTDGSAGWRGVTWMDGAC